MSLAMPISSNSPLASPIVASMVALGEAKKFTALRVALADCKDKDAAIEIFKWLFYRPILPLCWQAFLNNPHLNYFLKREQLTYIGNFVKHQFKRPDLKEHARLACENILLTLACTKSCIEQLGFYYFSDAVPFSPLLAAHIAKDKEFLTDLSLSAVHWIIENCHSPSKLLVELASKREYCQKLSYSFFLDYIEKYPPLCEHIVYDEDFLIHLDYVHIHWLINMLPKDEQVNDLLAYFDEALDDKSKHLYKWALHIVKYLILHNERVQKGLFETQEYRDCRTRLQEEFHTDKLFAKEIFKKNIADKLVGDKSKTLTHPLFSPEDYAEIFQAQLEQTQNKFKEMAIKGDVDKVEDSQQSKAPNIGYMHEPRLTAKVFVLPDKRPLKKKLESVKI